MRMKKIAKAIVVIAAAGCAAAAWAGVPVKVETESPIKLSIGGFAATENGQFVNGSFLQKPMEARGWLNRIYGQISLTAQINQYLSIHIAPEVWLWFDTYPWQSWVNEAFTNPFTQRSTVYFGEAQGILEAGDPSKISYLFAAGVFPFKYNPDAKNLGEYLFRTGARPAYVYTSFDYAYARLNGFRLNTRIYNSISLDIFLTTQTQSLPNLDWSLSCIAGYKMPGGLLNAGAGVMLDRVFPVNETSWEPKLPVNQYLTIDKKKEYYHFGGTKFVGNLTIDPKALLDESTKEVLGKEDFRIYGEAAVLGLENTNAYKYYMDTTTGLLDTNAPPVYDSAKSFYNNIKQRIPIMIGVTLPTFKYMDFLSVELEWYDWPYSNSLYQGGFTIPMPQPGQAQNVKPEFYTHDNYKFSFNAKKTFFNSFSIIAQVARDHSRHDIFAPSQQAKNTGEEVLSRQESFGWWVKLQYKF